MSPPTQVPSQRLGRYVLLGRLGRGGMGEVHRARAFGAAGVTKELCIKRIRQSRLAEPRALSRFIQEARLWMQLSHANIVQVFDFGRIDNDYFLAMEWVDGCDLRALLDDVDARGVRLAEEEALFLAGELARALSYLHDAGEGRAVAHCDLKPGNVLVSRKSEVKLADFGVAVAASSARAGGTRGYMPPAEADRVGTEADLYALGRVLHDLAERSEALPGTELVRRMAEDLAAATPTRRAAATIERELEAALAAARVRSGRSPRELLAARVAGVPSGEHAEHESVETDASFLGSADEASFLARMEPASEHPTETRSAPLPAPAAPRQRRGPALGALGVLGALGLVFGLRFPAAGDSERTSVPPAVATERPAGAPAPAAAPPPVPAPPTSPPLAASTPLPASPGPRRAESLVETPHRGRVPAPLVEEPPAPASLRVNARPWADVEIDGAAHGATPLRGIELAPGRHIVRLINPATGREQTVELRLAPGEHRDVIGDLR